MAIDVVEANIELNLRNLSSSSALVAWMPRHCNGERREIRLVLDRHVCFLSATLGLTLNTLSTVGKNQITNPKELAFEKQREIDANLMLLIY